MTLACTHLTVKQGGFSASSPQTLTSSSVTVTTGGLLLVAVDGFPSSAVASSFTVSDSSSLTWTPLTSAITNGSETTQVFSAVAGSTTSITVTVVMSTPSNATTLSGAFSVDQVTGQGSTGSNFVSSTENYTTTPGAALPTTPATTSLVYGYYAGQANAPASGTLTAPSGFTSLQYSPSPSTANALDGIETCYKIGSASQTNNWTNGVIQPQAVVFWEIPAGSSSITKTAATGRIVIRGLLGGTAIVLGATPGRLVIRGAAPHYLVSGGGGGSGGAGMLVIF